MDTVPQKVAACGQDLDIENRLVLVLAFHFAQVWGLPVPEQVLQQVLSIGAADLRLEVATAGSTETIVGRPTRGRGAGVCVGNDRVHRQRPPRRWRCYQVATHQLSALDQLKLVATELSGLRRSGGRGDLSPESVRAAP